MAIYKSFKNAFVTVLKFVLRHWVFTIALMAVTGVVCAQMTSEAWLAPLVQPTLVKGGGKNLIVLVPAFTMTSKNLSSLTSSLQNVRKDANLLLFDYPTHLTSNANPYQIADRINTLIEQEFKEKKYEKITMIGHSMGAVLARKAFVYGSGDVTDLYGTLALAKNKSEWVDHVDRFVLLAGTNRGWTLDPKPAKMPWPKAVFFRACTSFGRWTGTFGLIRHFERGAPFVANLRVQWLRLFRNSEAKKVPFPTVIQLLGDDDDVMTKEDNADVNVSLNFYFAPVGNAGHVSVIQFDNPESGEQSRKAFEGAVSLDTKNVYEPFLKSLAVYKNEVDSEVNAITFVMHGIRDWGNWTNEFVKPLQTSFEQLHGGQKMHVELSGYGYFPMGRFLFLEDRQKNVRWFMDRYTEALARYPKAADNVNFIGHSNGTYLLSSGLEQYRTLRVNRVAFAGSVAPRQYDWNARFDAGQVKEVRNYMASEDLVVGWFPHLFEVFGDIGSAGLTGFEQGRGKEYEIKFVPGDHSVVINSPAWRNSMVRFIIDDPSSQVPQPPTLSSPSPFVDYSSRICWVVWVIIVGIVYLIGLMVAWITKAFKPAIPTSLIWLSYGCVLIVILWTI